MNDDAERLLEWARWEPDGCGDTEPAPVRDGAGDAWSRRRVAYRDVDVVEIALDGVL